jgi:hypothetical protein
MTPVQRHAFALPSKRTIAKLTLFLQMLAQLEVVKGVSVNEIYLPTNRPSPGVPTDMPATLSLVTRHAGMPVGSCWRRAYHRERRRHAVLIAFAAKPAPTSRDFVPWRF